MSNAQIFIFLINILFTLAISNGCDSGNNCPEGCIQFHNCPQANILARTHHRYDQKVIELFRSSICGNSRRRDYILCNNIKAKYRELIKESLPSLDNCGLSNTSPRIAHGKKAALDDFPWLALLKYKNVTGHFSFRCHGSLISEKYVLTAAHCLDLSEKQARRRGELYSVVLGEYDITKDIDCVNPDDCADPIQEFGIHSFAFHPSTSVDVGLIRLNGTVDMSSEFVRPICLPFNMPPLTEDVVYWISGWGRTEKNRRFSDVKLKANVFLYNKDQCSKRIHSEPSASYICAGSDDGSDSCSGDSGGPLMADRIYNKDRKFFVIGIVSYGPRCGSLAGMYANVSTFRDWILENIEF